jgi:hypothetical protein
MKQPLFIVVAFAILTSASCGKSDKLYPVNGKVIVNGEPAVHAAVFLRQANTDPLNQRMIMGIVREDGHFSVVCESLGEGAPPGEYDVLIEWKHDQLRRRTGSNTLVPADRLNGAFSDPKQPRFHVTVKAERNNLSPFELKD